MKYFLLQLICSVVSFSLAAQPQKSSLSLLPTSTRALVMGISAQQDGALPALPANRQNAELYAAFLHTRGGGLLPLDHIQLITGEKATLAAFSTAIGWLEEESQLGDDIVVYMAGNARILPTDQGPKPHFFFADSPLALAGAGSIALPKLYYKLQEIALKKNLRLSILLDLYTDKTSMEEQETWLQWMESFQKSLAYGWSGQTMAKGRKKQGTKDGYTSVLLDALLGQADLNKDGKILPKELAAQITAEQKQVPGNCALLLSFPDKNRPVAIVDNYRGFKKRADMPTVRFPSLISNELSHLEDSLLTQADDRVRTWYLDYLLTLKLGQLMMPSGRCSSDLYDSLLTQSELRALHGQMRRQLAAALQDETQQALNNYLRTDTRELKRRWQHSGNYADYPRYLERVVELMGENHFMNGIIQCKKFYFTGLSNRLDFELQKDSQLLHTALQNQQRSLNYEPEAAFVLNEMGILRSIMKMDSATDYYHKAIDFAPQWGIPFYNLSRWYLDGKQLDSALCYATAAVERSPANASFMDNLANIHNELNQYELAEEWLLRAVSLDPYNKILYYNLCCTKVLQGKPTDALKWLEKAFQNGYQDMEQLNKDPDLTSLREMKRFDDLIAQYPPK